MTRARKLIKYAHMYWMSMDSAKEAIIYSGIRSCARHHIYSELTKFNILDRLYLISYFALKAGGVDIKIAGNYLIFNAYLGNVLQSMLNIGRA